jgi:hypothetical protein
VAIVEDGREVKPESVETFAGPLLVIFVVDVSGTMSGPPIAEARNAIRLFAQKMGPNDQLAIVSFSDQVEVVRQISKPTDLEPDLNRLHAVGRTTELYRALIKALELTRVPNLPERKIVLALSDGKDEGRAYSIDDVIRQAQSDGAPIYSVGLGFRFTTYLKQLERISLMTSGIHAEALGLADISDLVLRMHQQIMGQAIVKWYTTLTDSEAAKTVQLKVQKDQYAKLVDLKLPSFKGGARLSLPVLGALAGGAALVVALAIVFAVRAKKRRGQLRAEQQRGDGLQRQQALEEQRRREAEGQAELARREKEELVGKVEQMGRDKRRACPKCGQVMLPEWTTCLFCARNDARRAALARNDVTVYSRAKIRFLTGPRQGELVGLPNAGELSIGSHKDNTLSINEPTVSRFHAALVVDRGRYFLMDLESKNKTIIDGQTVPPHSLLPLADGQRIVMGQVNLQFEAE